MTRETKIGLLVGLAFIVVFAMLLSHTGPVTTPGDGLQYVKPRVDTSPLATGERPADPAGPVAPAPELPLAQGSPPPTDIAKPSPTTPGPVVELPKPDVFETAPGTTAGATQPPPAPADTGESSALAGIASATETRRVAPPLPAPVVEPSQTPRASTPTETTATSDTAVASADTPPSRETTVAPVATGNQPKDKEYTVRKGQTLVQIAKDVYGSGSTKVIDFIVKSNKMKSRDRVVEGQKLMTPNLPPDLFEPVTSISVARPTAQTVSLDTLVNPNTSPTTRHAPTLHDATTRKDAEPKSQKERTYEVKSNQTFSSIAREELGSESMWREIQKLNKGVDPSKLKPGTKIKLPAKHQGSSTDVSGSSRGAA